MAVRGQAHLKLANLSHVGAGPLMQLLVALAPRGIMSAATRRISRVLQLRVSFSIGAESDQEGEHDSGTAAGNEEVGGRFACRRNLLKIIDIDTIHSLCSPCCKS